MTTMSWPRRVARFTLLPILIALAKPLPDAIPVARAQEAVAPPAACGATDAYIDADDALPHVARAIRGGQLSVLAVGSGTMAAANDEGSFPNRMAAALRQARPGVTVRLTVRGGRGLTATNMIGTVRAELAHAHYDLVLWQTGTVEAVRGLSSSEFYDTLMDGAAAIGEASADLILIDPQYSRFLQANADLDPYEQSLQQAAALPSVVLFHRYELMRDWAESGRIDLERAGSDERAAANRMLHACLGESLARLVLAEAREPAAGNP